LIDCTSWENPHYLVIETKNYNGNKIKERLTEIQVKDLIEMTDIEVKIRQPLNKDFE